MSTIKVARDNVGRLLLTAAKKHKGVAIGLARLLVSPGGFFAFPPRFKLSELLTGIRVAELVPTLLWDFSSQTRNENFETLSRRWRNARLTLFWGLREHIISRSPPLTTVQVRKATDVFQRVPGCADTLLNDLRHLHAHLNTKEEEWESLGFSRTPWEHEKRTPRRGNRVSEHHQRIVAAIELLKNTHYNEIDALSVVSGLLSSYAIQRKSDSLRKLCDRYQSAHSSNRPGCQPSPKDLPNYWLDGRLERSLGSYLLWRCSVEKITLKECLKRVFSSAYQL